MGSSGAIVAQEHKLLAFIVLALVLNEMVLALEKKRWNTGVSRLGYRDWDIEYENAYRVAEYEQSEQ
ncbi:MAG: hypothetical protein ACK5PD_05985 [Pirellulaceae bacterium]|jgi:hypothetical protein